MHYTIPTILYYTNYTILILCYTIPYYYYYDYDYDYDYYTILYYTILYYTILYYTIGRTAAPVKKSCH